jgi:hypothetical protein
MYLSSVRLSGCPAVQFFLRSAKYVVASSAEEGSSRNFQTETLPME